MSTTAMLAACLMSSVRGWHEVWLCDDVTRSHSKSPGAAVARGDAVLVLPGIIDTRECASLLRIAEQMVERQEVSMRRRLSAAAHEFTSNNARSPGRTRVPIDTLPTNAKRAYNAAFSTILTFVDDELPSVATLFESAFHHEEDSRQSGIAELRSVPAGTDGSRPPNLAEMHASGRLEFSSREPAINTYTAGSGFNAHTDRQTLTVLLYLTPPDACEGGGTGFWCQGASAVDDLPTAVIHPPAGTALVYGGRVTHAGMPLISGRRTIYLGSFSACRPDLQLLESD